MHQPVELRHLAVFQTVVQQGSINRAAAILGMSQPGLSRLLTRLEQRMGATLLARSAAGVTPTAAGEVLLARADAIRDLLRDLPHACTQAEPGAQTLRIGCYENSTQRFLPRLAEALPWLTVRLTASRTEIILPMLDRGELDVCVVWDIAAHPYRPGPDIHTAPVVHEPAWLATSIDHRLARQDQVSMQDLVDEQWILSDSPPLQQLVAAACAHAGYRPRVAHVVGQATTMEALITDGEGITLAAPTLADHVAARLGLRIVPVVDPLLRRVFVAWSATRVSPATAGAIVTQARHHYLACAREAAAYAAVIQAHPEQFPHLPTR